MDTHGSQCFFKRRSVYSTGNDPNPTDIRPSGGEVLTHFCHFISSVKSIRSDVPRMFHVCFRLWVMLFPTSSERKSWTCRDLHACCNVSVWGLWWDCLWRVWLVQSGLLCSFFQILFIYFYWGGGELFCNVASRIRTHITYMVNKAQCFAPHLIVKGRNFISTKTHIYVNICYIESTAWINLLFWTSPLIPD